MEGRDSKISYESLVLGLTPLLEVVSEFEGIMSQVKTTMWDLSKVSNSGERHSKELASIKSLYEEHATLFQTNYNPAIKALTTRLMNLNEQTSPSELAKAKQNLDKLQDQMTVLKRAAQKLNENINKLDQQIKTEKEETKKASQDENQRNYEIAKYNHRAQSETLDRNNESFQEIREQQAEKLHDAGGDGPSTAVQKFLNAWEEESQTSFDEINAELENINQQMKDLKPHNNPNASPEEWEELREQQDELSQRMTEWEERETAFYNRSNSLINLLNAQKDSQQQLARANAAIEDSSQYAKTLFELSEALKIMPEQSQSYIETHEEILQASVELNQTTQDLSRGLNQVLQAFVANDGSFQSIVNEVGSLYEAVNFRTRELEKTLDEVGEQEIAGFRLEDVVTEKVSVQTCANQLIENEQRIQAEKLAEEQRIQAERQLKVVALREGYDSLPVEEAKTQLRTADEYAQKLNMLANSPYNTAAQSESYQQECKLISRSREALKNNLESLSRDLDPLAEAISHGTDKKNDHEHWNKMSREFSQNLTALSTKLAELSAQDVDGTPLKDVTQESIDEKVQQKITELTSKQRELAREIPLIKLTSDQLLDIALAGDSSKNQPTVDITKMFADVQQKLGNKLGASFRGAINNFCRKQFGWVPFADFERKQNDLRGQVSLAYQFIGLLGAIDSAQGLNKQANALFQAQAFWQQNSTELTTAFKSDGTKVFNAVNNHFGNLAEPLAAQSNQQLEDSTKRQQQVSHELIQLHSYKPSAVGRAAYTPVLVRARAEEPSLGDAAGRGYGINHKPQANTPEVSQKPPSSHP